MQHPRLLTTKEAAEYLGMSPRTLEGYRSRGGGPQFMRLGRRSVRYDPDALQQWATAQTVRSTSAYLVAVA